MNQFFKPKQTVFFFICCAICLLVLLFTYAKLSLQPVTPVAQNLPAVERGSIVDRSGFPLAVQTNFYHVGVSVKNLRDSEKLKNRFANDVAPLLEMLPEDVLDILDTNKSFVYLKKKITQTMYEPLKQLTDEKGYNFISYEKIPGRNHAICPVYENNFSSNSSIINSCSLYVLFIFIPLTYFNSFSLNDTKFPSSNNPM